ncbi:MULTISPECIES: serine hydrolase [unclassified Mycobacterium]|uniref:serine hydrolase domain-containing protein n=1 Tax=unclassified Mycobacterium TaxID=2642494 RepID=UPI0007FB7B60|nr:MULTISPECIES: serine hydrolase domain-containing protein [unclassified Mycobacterium]OBH00954.1 serine hydrolase [Mycobacterium sp. E2699]OBI54833.1 serine hydrolase [Mycobacterium sp. E787]
MPGKRSARKVIAVGAALLVLAAASAPGYVAPSAVSDGPRASQAPPPPAPPPPEEPAAPPAPEFATVSRLMNDAIAARRLPGAVVVIGHGGKVAFHQAYGSRKLAGEPGLDGAPAPAEPMTEDTIFDLASLTKCLATATAIMQLYEQGKVQFDDPVQKYLPDFNAANDPQRAEVTVRMLLTNTSGEGIDVSLGDPWGLDGSDKAEGVHRALSTPLQSGPGAVFRYSDINYILLGALLEKVTGEAEDDYVQQNVFAPLGIMQTRYLPAAKACGPQRIRGSAIAWAPAPPGREPEPCPAGAWSAGLLPRIAPTALDEESRADPGKNPDYGYLLRGTVHDPTARRMGGVAGNAGVFATAHDVGVYAQALLDRLAGRPSDFPLQPATLELMTTPQQPGHTPQQLKAANEAARAANYPAVRGQNLFGFGWDIDTGFSRPRGTVFPVGSFGNTGFTGTTLWLDPGSDTYVVLLSNSIHLRGSPPISDLRGEVATAAARALRLYGSTTPPRR